MAGKMLKFVDKSKSGFYLTLKKRVDAYFDENHISRNGNAMMYIKTLVFLGGAIGFYLLIILGGFSNLTNLFLAIAMGTFCAFIGFNISHDAIHGSYSSNETINKILSYTFELIGGNQTVWRVSHNNAHHMYTNIAGHDEDLEVAPGLIRLSPEDKKYKIQKFQHYYGFLLYGFASLSWVLKKDYVKFFQKKIGGVDNTGHTFREIFELFFFKLVHYYLLIVLPFQLLDVSIGQFILGFVCFHLAFGLVLGLVFQLAHVVEGVEFPNPNEDGNIEEAWAIHQLRTTADFSRSSFLAFFLCGGLNFQVEHHLFPKICHVHYPALSKIVEATANEFGIPYHENKTFGKALASHYHMLKKFGPDAQKSTVKNTPVAA